MAGTTYPTERSKTLTFKSMPAPSGKSPHFLYHYPKTVVGSATNGNRIA
ncbi:hypothetical protein [Flexibacter flexilis]|nr:hypothetical protein [Flexibacter flexilis]